MNRNYAQSVLSHDDLLDRTVSYLVGNVSISGHSVNIQPIHYINQHDFISILRECVNRRFLIDLIGFSGYRLL